MCHEFQRTAYFVFKPMVGGLCGGMVMHCAVDASDVAHGLYYGSHVVAHEHYGALFVERLQQRVHVVLAVAVDIGGGFVEYQQSGLRGEGSGHQHPLSLAARPVALTAAA